ncbi:MAG: hypothetical protein ACLP01_05410 [Solirubrobacteraceae bacterium]
MKFRYMHASTQLNGTPVQMIAFDFEDGSEIMITQEKDFTNEPHVEVTRKAKEHDDAE